MTPNHRKPGRWRSIAPSSVGHSSMEITPSPPPLPGKPPRTARDDRRRTVSSSPSQKRHLNTVARPRAGHPCTRGDSPLDSAHRKAWRAPRQSRRLPLALMSLSNNLRAPSSSSGGGDPLRLTTLPPALPRAGAAAPAFPSAPFPPSRHCRHEPPALLSLGRRRRFCALTKTMQQGRVLLWLILLVRT